MRTTTFVSSYLVTGNFLNCMQVVIFAFLLSVCRGILISSGDLTGALGFLSGVQSSPSNPVPGMGKEGSFIPQDDTSGSDSYRPILTWYAVPVAGLAILGGCVWLCLTSFFAHAILVIVVSIAIGSWSFIYFKLLRA